MRRPRVEVGRVYDEPVTGEPGRRVLVDRLWPRGVSKGDADWEWLKDVAPSTELRQWYGHDVARFEEFSARYRAELRDPPASDALERLAAAAREGPLTLLTATRDVEHSAARVLQQALNARVG